MSFVRKSYSKFWILIVDPSPYVSFDMAEFPPVHYLIHRLHTCKRDDIRYICKPLPINVFLWQFQDICSLAALCVSCVHTRIALISFLTWWIDVHSHNRMSPSFFQSAITCVLWKLSGGNPLKWIWETSQWESTCPWMSVLLADYHWIKTCFN